MRKPTSVQKINLSPSEMRRRLSKMRLIKNLIQDCGDTLHTKSRKAVANNVVEALKNGKGNNHVRLYYGIKLGLHLMSDTNIAKDLIEELRGENYKE